MQNRFKCAKLGCNKFASITSGTLFAHKRITFMELLLVIRAMAVHAKGASSIWLSHDCDFDYKTIRVVTEKLREAMFIHQENVLLVGEVEINDVYFGG